MQASRDLQLATDAYRTIPLASARVTLAGDLHSATRADQDDFAGVQRCSIVRGIVMIETEYTPHERVSPHDHEHPNFFMPLNHTFIEGCGTGTRHILPNDVSYHPAYEPHWGYVDGGREAVRAFIVAISDDWLDADRPPVEWESAPRDMSHSRVPWLLAQLYRELDTKDTALALVVEALGVEIGAELNALRTRFERHVPSWLTRVRDLLIDRLHETVSLAELESVAPVSRFAIIKAFRRHEGMTPGEFVRLARLREARQMLAGTTWPLSMIALRAGFYDQSHFSRAFKTIAGVSPAAFRRMVRRPIS